MNILDPIFFIARCPTICAIELPEVRTYSKEKNCTSWSNMRRVGFTWVQYYFSFWRIAYMNLCNVKEQCETEPLPLDDHSEPTDKG